jgi:hypothetical protein
VQTAIGAHENDALWLVLLALQYYDSLYKQYPKAIAAEAQTILRATRATADATIRASAAAAQADLAKAIASAAREVARDAARRQMLHWLVIGMAVGAGLLGGGAVIGMNRLAFRPAWL